MSNCFANQTYCMGPMSALMLESTQEDQIYKDMIYDSDHNLIDEYNYMIENTIPSIFCSRPHVVSSDLEYHVEGVEVQFPSFCVGIDRETSTRLLTPHIAEMEEQDYVCRVICDIKSVNPLTGIVIGEESRCVGTIPCMVGSNRCITSQKPDEIGTLEEWKLMCGEDPSIQGGCFIKDGSRKVFLLGEKLGTNTIFTVETKGENPRIETRITEMSRSKTTLIRIQNGKRRASVKILCPHLKGKHYPLFFVMYFLSLDAIRGKYVKNFVCKDFVDDIVKLAPIKEQEYIRTYLETSVTIFNSKFLSYNSERDRMEIDNSKISEYITHKVRGQEDSSNYTINGVLDLLKSEISPSAENMVEKIANIELMVCQQIRCCLGLRSFDSRDSWKNKRLDSPVRLIEQQIADQLVENLKTRTGDDGSWRIGKNDKKENIVESYKMDTISLQRSLYSKVNALVDSKSKSFTLRAVTQSAFGGICPAKTSEGEKCGINKHSTICARISYNSEHIPNRLDPIFGILKIIEYSDLHQTSTCKYAFGIASSDNHMKLRIDGKTQVFVSDKFLNLLEKRNPTFVIQREKFDAILVVDEFSDEPSSITMWNGQKIKAPLSGEHLRELKYCFSIINDMVALKQSRTYSYAFTYNGNILLNKNNDKSMVRIRPEIIWVNPEIIVPFIKEYRRVGVLPNDCCVYKNNVDEMVQYYDDSGRLMCPYLVAGKDGNLILDTLEDGDFKNRIWKGSELLDYSTSNLRVKELYNAGAMELIDAKEIDTIFIADTISEFRRFANLRYFLNHLDIKGSDYYVYPLKGKDTFHVNDISYVIIDDKKYDVEFTRDVKKDALSIEARVKPNEMITLYGQIVMQSKEFTKSLDRVLTLDKPENCHIRDGFHLCYIENDEVVWVPKGGVGMSTTKYNGHKIVPVKFDKDRISKICTKTKKGYTLRDHNLQFLENVGKEWFFIKDDEVIWTDDRFDSRHEEPCYHVTFGKENQGFFKSKPSSIYVDLDENADYIIEKFDIDVEKSYFDGLEEKNASGDRECDLLMANIRRNQDVLDILETSDDPSEIFRLLRKKFPSFTKRANIYKVMRYLNWKFKFSHCPIDPNIAYSAMANFVPLANYSQGPRFTYQCSMGTQALGLGNIMHFASFKTSMKRMIAPKQHLFETIAEEPLAAVTMPTRENFMVAVYTHRRGFEDALIFSKSVYKHFARYEREVTITVREKSSGSYETVTFPLDKHGNKKTGPRYDCLDHLGIPKVGSILSVGDVVVGQMKNDLKGGEKRDISRTVQVGEDGEVIQVRITSTEGSNGKERLFRIKIAQRRFVQEGDKFAAIPAQKGTIAHFSGSGDTGGRALDYTPDSIQDIFFSAFDQQFKQDLDSGKIRFKIIDDNDMPIVIGGPNDGMSIHILFSPLSFPSRMTMGMNFELFTGKGSLRLQKKFNATNFRAVPVKFFEEVLVNNGIDKNGCEFIAHSNGELMIDSTNGRPMKVFIGPCSYQELKHHSKDKKSVREKGKRDRVIRQPIGGRKLEKGGAHRFGEMERDALLSHGAPNLLLDRLKYGSDIQKSIYCKGCGNRSSESDVTKQICRVCGASDTLITCDQTRVYTVFCQMVNGLGLNVSMNFEEQKTIKNNFTL